MMMPPDHARPGVFEVFRTSGAGPNDDWCAAGGAIDRIRNMPPNTRIYVLRPLGPSQLRPGRTSASFPIVTYPEVAGAAARGLSLNMRQVGCNLRAAYARSGCGNGVRQHSLRSVPGGV